MTETLKIRNPRTGEIDYETPTTSPEELAQIATELRAAQPAWEALGLEGRLAVLNRWRAEYDKVQDAILNALVADTGRVVEAKKEMFRLPSSIDKLTVMAREVFHDRTLTLRSMPNVEVHGGLSPFPLVGVISPWNFPLSMSLLDTMPALVAGCAVIVKPSEVTPRFVPHLAATLEAVPELKSVLRFVVGGPALGAALVGEVDAICFTGSIATGQKVAAAAGAAFIPAFLELGGKDPAIVMPSADIRRSAASVVAGSVSNAGQVCVSLERIYVARDIAEPFIAALVDEAQKIRPAYPDYDAGTLGPIILESQAKMINHHLQDAIDKGARILCGGMVEQKGGGWWASPTVVVDVTHDMDLMRDETFGPIMPVMVYDDLDEALRLANDSQYGLSGAVFAGSPDEALPVARRMQVGSVAINATGLGTAAIGEGDFHEKTAFKRSGLSGSRLGYDSITRFMRKKAYLVNA